MLLPSLSFQDLLSESTAQHITVGILIRRHSSPTLSVFSHPSTSHFIRLLMVSRDIACSKRLRTAADDGEELTDEEYKEAVKMLDAEYKKSQKGGRNQARIKELMGKTKKRRRMWIVQERPLVWEELEIFLSLGSSRGVSVLEYKYILFRHCITVQCIYLVCKYS